MFFLVRSSPRCVSRACWCEPSCIGSSLLFSYHAKVFPRLLLLCRFCPIVNVFRRDNIRTFLHFSVDVVAAAVRGLFTCTLMTLLALFLDIRLVALVTPLIFQGRRSFDVRIPDWSVLLGRKGSFSMSSLVSVFLMAVGPARRLRPLPRHCTPGKT